MNNSFSIIIPAYNEERAIERTLRSIFDSAGGDRKYLEMIIVDAASEDDTAEVSAALLDKLGFAYQILRMDVTTYPGGARNRGAEAASHPNIIFIDSGVTIGREFLMECDRQIEKNDFVWFRPGFVFEKTFQAAYVRPYFIRRVNGRYIRHCAARKEKLVSLGGFREDLRAAEDWLFYKKLAGSDSAEFFSEVGADYYGYPPSLGAFYRKWRVYFEHSVYAGLHGNNIRNSVVQVCFVIVLFLLLKICGAGAAVSVLAALAAYITARGALSFIKSGLPVQGIIDFFYTFVTSVILEVSRITGVINGIRMKRREPNQ